MIARALLCGALLALCGACCSVPTRGAARVAVALEAEIEPLNGEDANGDGDYQDPGDVPPSSYRVTAGWLLRRLQAEQALRSALRVCEEGNPRCGGCEDIAPALE